MDWTDNYDSLRAAVGFDLTNSECKAAYADFKKHQDAQFRQLSIELAKEGKTMVERLFEE